MIYERQMKDKYVPQYPRIIGLYILVHLSQEKDHIRFGRNSAPFINVSSQKGLIHKVLSSSPTVSTWAVRGNISTATACVKA